MSEPEDLRGRFVKNIEESCAGVKKHYDKFVKSESADALHDLRVSIRRVRSRINVSEELFNVKVKKSYKKGFKEIFAITSKLRDLDTLLEFATSIDDRDIITKLTRKIDKLRKKRMFTLRKSIEDMDVPELIKGFERSTKERFEKNAHKITHEQLKRFLMERVAYIREDFEEELSLKSLDRERLHELRKAFKRVRYQTEFGGKAYKDVYQRCKDIQDILGKINDFRTWKEELATLTNDEILKDIDLLLIYIQKEEDRMIESYCELINAGFVSEIEERIRAVKA